MTTDKQSPPTLSRRMRSVLAADGPHFGRPRARPKELAAIKHALRRKGKDHPELSVGKLMRVAVDADPGAETAKLVAKILADSKLKTGLRRQAASLLGEMPVAAARNALLKQLTSGDNRFEPTILTALAKVGDARSLQAINKLTKTSSARLQQMRNFVVTVIAYRNDEKVSRSKEHSVIPRSIPLQVEAESRANMKTVLGRLRGSTYGMQLKKDLGYCFMCGETKHVILINDELRAGAMTASLLEKRRLAGVIAMQESDSSDYVTRHLIFVKPARGKAVISITNTTGEVVMMGKLSKGQTGLEVSMRDHTHARFPSNVSGLITDSEVFVGGELFLEFPREKDGGEVDTSVYTN